MHSPVFASRQRVLLATYLDFLIYACVYTMVGYAVGGLVEMYAWGFALVTSIATRVKHLRSPARYLLGIGLDNRVDDRVWLRESYISLTLGTFLIMEASKQFVRWSQFMVPEPHFGIMLNGVPLIAVHLINALVLGLAAGLILRTHGLGWLLAAVGVLANLISAVLSRPLWDGYVSEYVTTIRGLQNRPLREGEIEFMQMVVPHSQIIISVVLLVLLALSRHRLMKNDTSVG